MEYAMRSKYVIPAMISGMALLAVGALVFLFGKAGSPLILDPYACPATAASSSTPGDSDCENHVFPSKSQVLDYFHDATFKRLNPDAGYTVRYFHDEKGREVDGHYREMALGAESPDELRVTTNHGPWWLRDVVIPMKSGKAVVDKQAQALCTHDKYWEPPQDDDNDDRAEDVYAYCDIVWDLSGRFLYGKSYREDVRWEKVASNDAFDLSDAVQDYSPDFTTPRREGSAGGDSSLSPVELADLIKAKNKETQDKMYKPGNPDAAR